MIAETRCAKCASQYVPAKGDMSPYCYACHQVRNAPKDNVNHPTHYQGADDAHEVIDVIEAHGLGKGFNRGNVIKYTLRAGRKGTSGALEDLRKAAWYIAREIKRLEGV